MVGRVTVKDAVDFDHLIAVSGSFIRDIVAAEAGVVVDKANIDGGAADFDCRRRWGGFQIPCGHFEIEIADVSLNYIVRGIGRNFLDIVAINQVASGTRFDGIAAAFAQDDVVLTGALVHPVVVVVDIARANDLSGAGSVHLSGEIRPIGL